MALILTYDHRVTCSLGGAAPDTFNYLSIVVSFSCDGVSLECDLRPDASLSGDGNYTLHSSSSSVLALSGREGMVIPLLFTIL